MFLAAVPWRQRFPERLLRRFPAELAEGIPGTAETHAAFQEARRSAPDDRPWGNGFYNGRARAARSFGATRSRTMRPSPKRTSASALVGST